MSVFSEEFTQGLFVAGEYPSELQIGMSSHDKNGQPLAIASIGSHAFDIDNIVMSVVPEPRFSSLIICGLLGMAFFVKKREAKASFEPLITVSSSGRR